MENKTYTLHGYTITKIEKGHYRITKNDRLQARKRTLELAKDWVRNKISDTHY
ncbi:hypothetical protein Q7A53_05700 [Halobacillus rhizosphaerae]|uniref:hypothetical protein n=1 Tax=Halobacillus rhizosphaerae TaxID=3064889 RepID=UPI00398BBA77